jgi:hypothetical protein
MIDSNSVCMTAETSSLLEHDYDSYTDTKLPRLPFIHSYGSVSTKVEMTDNKLESTFDSAYL